MKKRLVAGLLAMVMVAGAMSACGSNAEDATQSETAEVAAESEQEVEEETSGDQPAEVATEVKEADILNDYDNTEELLAKFPIVNETPVEDGIGKKIQNRLLTGFENWNRGFDAWKAWGDILYTEDSIYNVHGVRMTLAEYQAAMDVSLQQMDIQMGNFNNMLICDNWTAIYYDTTMNGKPSNVMEFVEFKDYGDELGTRVVEGWGGPKDDSFAGMQNFQTDEEKAKQQEMFDEILAYEIPDEKDLEKKYPVKNPTTDNSEMASQIRGALLKDFDEFNKGADEYEKWCGKFFTEDAKITAYGEDYDSAGYAKYVKDTASGTEITKLYFDNMLISGDWAALHYRTAEKDQKTGDREPDDKMEFFHFVKDGDGVKVDTCIKK